MAECWYCGGEAPEGVAGRSGGLCGGCEYMTIYEVGTRLHVTRQTVMRLLSDGRLTRVKPLPGRVLIRRSQVEKLLRG